MIDLRTMQKEVRAWGKKHFPGAEPHYCVLGAMEELGELAHAHLRLLERLGDVSAQEAKERDAVGDVVVFLAHFCEMKGYDLESIIKGVWQEVQERASKRYPNNGL